MAEGNLFPQRQVLGASRATFFELVCRGPWRQSAGHGLSDELGVVATMNDEF